MFILQAVKILQFIPPADIYILESKHNAGTNKSSTKMNPYSHQLELTSMLLALINTSEKHNDENKATSTKQYPNKVYYLRSQLPAR